MDALRHDEISSPVRIVVGLIEHIGDIVACEPVVRYLKHNNPQSHITWVVTRRYREIIDTNPYIDETLAVNASPTG